MRRRGRREIETNEIRTEPKDDNHIYLKHKNCIGSSLKDPWVIVEDQDESPMGSYFNSSQFSDVTFLIISYKKKQINKRIKSKNKGEKHRNCNLPPVGEVQTPLNSDQAESQVSPIRSNCLSSTSPISSPISFHPSFQISSSSSSLSDTQQFLLSLSLHQSLSPILPSSSSSSCNSSSSSPPTSPLYPLSSSSSSSPSIKQSQFTNNISNIDSPQNQKQEQKNKLSNNENSMERDSNHVIDLDRKSKLLHNNKVLIKKRLFAHKMVLSAHSQVFKTMFMSGFKESQQNEIEIEELDDDDDFFDDSDDHSDNDDRTDNDSSNYNDDDISNDKDSNDKIGEKLENCKNGKKVDRKGLNTSYGSKSNIERMKKEEGSNTYFMDQKATRNEELEENDSCDMTEVFSLMIEFMYKRKIMVRNEKTVLQLLILANKYEVKRLLKNCCESLLNLLNHENCFQYFQVCSKIGLQNSEDASYVMLKNKVMQQISEQFETVISSRWLMNLDCELLIEFLKDDDLNVTDECVVLQCIVNWITYDLKQRGKELEHLIDYVRLDHVDVKAFATIIEKNQFLKMNLKFMQLANDMLLHHHAQMKGISFGMHRIIPKHRKGYVSTWKQSRNWITVSRCAFKIAANDGWQYDNKKIDAIDFSCSRQLEFAAIGVCCGKGQYCTLVQIIDTEDCKILYEHEFRYLVGHTLIHKLTFSSTIQIIPLRRYTVKLAIQGPSSCYVESGQECVSVDGIKFQFYKSNFSTNLTNVSWGQIPELYFFY